MKFGYQLGSLMDGHPGAAGGDAPGVSQELKRAINDEINAAFASWDKKELPKLLSNTMKDVMTQNAESIGDMVLNRIQANLPSDDEIDQMDAQDAGGGQGQGDEGDGQDLYLPPELVAELNDLRKSKSEFDEFRSNWERDKQQLEMQAEEADRQSTIQAALNKYPFANDDSREVAFNYFDVRSERDKQTGELVAGGLPIGKYVEERMGNLSGLLASRSVGGSGAVPAGRIGAAPQMEDIKLGMTPEKKAEILSYATAHLPDGFRPGT